MLIQDIATLRKHVRFLASGEFDAISPFIADAQNTVLDYYLGAALITQLETFITEASTDATSKQLLELARAALAPLSLMLATNESSFNFGDAGHTVTRTTTLAPVSETKLALAREDFKKRGYANIEKLLVFLELNESTFPAWALSHYKQSPTSFYFRNATDFQIKGGMSIYFSRLFFAKILPAVRFVELTEIHDLLPDSITILDPFASTLSEDEIYLVALIQQYVAAKSIFDTISNAENVAQPNEYSIDYVIPNSLSRIDYYHKLATYFRARIVGCLKDRFAIDNTINFNSEEQKTFYAG